MRFTRIKNGLMIITISIIINSISMLSGYFGWNIQFVVISFTFLIGGLFFNNRISFITYFSILTLPFFTIYTFHIIRDSLIHVLPIALTPYISLSIGLYCSKLIIKKQRAKLTYILLVFTIILTISF